ncbi:MAG TPA: MFS transporter, partial [Ktedonobacterales bacterium]
HAAALDPLPAASSIVAHPVPARRRVPSPLARARQLIGRRIAAQPLWRNHTYLTLWGGRLVSATGSQMSQLAFPLLVLLLTGSAAIAGLAGALRMLPYLVLTLPAGVLVDRWDRRKLMLACDTGRALALGSIPLALVLGRLSVAQIFAVALVEGTLYVFFDLAETAALPSIVPPEQMPAATAQYLGLTDGVTLLLGPALGGALFAVGRMVPFLADAISYGVSVVALSRVKLPRTQAQAPEAAAESAVSWRVMRRDIVEGMRWLWRQPLLRALTAILAISNLLTAGEALVVIVLAERLHASMGEIGLIVALGGVGTVLGALLAERITRRLSFGQAFTGANWLIALVWFGFALAPAPLWLGVALAINGGTFAVLNVVQYSRRMALIPDEMQGRINSIIRLLIYGAVPLGLAVMGLLIERVGPVATALLLGVGLVGLALRVTLDPHFRPSFPRRLALSFRR